MEWIPIVFVAFKALVLGTGAFYAIKWHYDQGRKGKAFDRRAALRGAGKVAAVFVLAMLAVALVTFVMVRVVGLNLVN